MPHLQARLAMLYSTHGEQPASPELIIKDLTTALGIGKEPGVAMSFAALAQRLYQLAQSMPGPQAPNPSAIKLYEGSVGVENRTK